MLCIEAGESFPEMSGGRTFLILGRGKDADIMRFSSASPFDGSAREELEKGERQVKKTRCESEKEITQIALMTRSGLSLSE